MAEESKKGYFLNPSSKTLKSSIDEGKSSTSGGTTKKVLVKSADMKEDMQKEAIDCAILAIEKHGVEKDIAEYIKKEFDKKHGPTWHCIVGRNFGSYVTHETHHFVYFYLDQKAILLFKSGLLLLSKMGKDGCLKIEGKSDYTCNEKDFDAGRVALPPW